MKKQEIRSLLSLLALPMGLIVVGVVLIFNPDSASALVSRLMGWGLVIGGVGTLCFGAYGRLFRGIGMICVGSFFLSNPLTLAAFVGRVIGVLLALRGIREMMQGRDSLLSALMAIVGVVLALLPMTTSRLVFIGCGVVVFILGLVMLIRRLKANNRLTGGKDDIIDAL